MSNINLHYWLTESMIPKLIMFLITIILLVILANISFKKCETIGESLGDSLTQIVEENNENN